MSILLNPDSLVSLLQELKTKRKDICDTKNELKMMLSEYDSLKNKIVRGFASGITSLDEEEEIKPFLNKKRKVVKDEDLDSDSDCTINSKSDKSGDEDDYCYTADDHYQVEKAKAVAKMNDNKHLDYLYHRKNKRVI